MNQEAIDAFQEATARVFQMMLGIEIGRGAAQECDLLLARHEVSGIIGLSGGLSGDVIVSLDEEVAILATEALLGEKPSELDGDVVEAVGEITNMIAGNAKGILEHHNMDLALPTVIIGKGHRIGLNTGICPVDLPFTSQWGSFSVAIGLLGVNESVAT